MATDDQRFLALQMAHTDNLLVEQVIERATAYLQFLMDDPGETVKAKKEQDKKDKEPHPDQELPKEPKTQTNDL
jgi:hypothetical protein